MADTPKFYGVLATYRRPRALEHSLSRLASQTKPLDELLVVDNGADESARRLVEAYSSRGLRASYVDAEGNIGPAGAFALGMDRVLEEGADDHWVFLFDDDDPPFYDDALEKAARFGARMLDLDPMTGAVGISGGRFDLRSGRVRRIGDDLIRGPVRVDHITAGGLPAYRVGAIRKVGVFRRELFFGFEELEYGLRLVHGGYSLYADGEAWRARKEDKRRRGLLPPENVSAERSRKTNFTVGESDWRRYYSLRNLLFILREYGTGAAALRVALTRGIAKPLVNLPFAPRLAIGNLRMNLAAIRDGFTGRMGRTVTPEVADG